MAELVSGIFGAVQFQLEQKHTTTHRQVIFVQTDSPLKGGVVLL
jgi:hypothetical protein